MINHKLVYIEWEDSQLGVQGWKFMDEQKPYKVPTMISVGFLIHEDDHCKVIYAHINPDNDNGTGDVLIPNSAIKKIRELTLPD